MRNNANNITKVVITTQIRKPENWQDFEKLCTKLWGEIWNCADTIKRNGRSGQAQHGVDIYGIPANKNCYYGVQCKGKNDYTQSILTKKEIEDEIEKAKSFKPALQKLIFATTASKDAEIEEYVRCKDLELRQKGLFSIDIYAWEDIVTKIEDYRNVWNWYVNNCMYNDVCDVRVSFLDKEETIIRPRYMRLHTSYQYSNMPASPFAYIKMPELPTLGSEPRQYDGRWCDLVIKVENTGSTTIEDDVLKVWFDDEIEEIDDNLNLCFDMWMNPAVRSEINQRKEAQREVFYSDEYGNMLECRSLRRVIVEHDAKIYHMKILPTIQQGDCVMHWQFLSRSYSKEGELKIHIDAEIEDEYRVEEVSYGSELPASKIELIHLFEKKVDK